MGYWLLKSEPSTFSIDDLAKSPGQVTSWEGVRNFQARNFLRDQMRQGDHAFFYHSSCKEPGIVGIVEIIREGYPDKTALDPQSQYYDASSTKENPKWYRVDVRLINRFPEIIPLAALRTNSALSNCPLLQKGNRLSVISLTSDEWKSIIWHSKGALSTNVQF